MTRFNSDAEKRRYEATTFNKGGFIAYSESDREKMATAVLTTFLSQDGKFYGSDEFNTVRNLAEKMAINDFLFLEKLAIYARNEFGMRSVSHLLVAVLAKFVKGDETLKNVIAKVCRRPDDMTEILSLYIMKYGKPIPNSLKKGFALAFSKFDEYQLAKYKQDGKSVSLKDILSISHAVPGTVERAALYNRVMNNNLAVPYTWEVELSKKGANKTEVWKNLLKSNKLGYLALIRNLRNMIEVADTELRNLIVAGLVNYEVIRKVGVFPFTYYISYTEIFKNYPNERAILRALETAMTFSVTNIEKFSGHTLIAVDNSGSMSDAVSAKGTATCNMIANTLAAIADQVCDVATVVSFNTTTTRRTMGNSILENIKNLPSASGGTNVGSPLLWALNSPTKYDRIILISDNETNTSFSSPSYYRSTETACQEITKKLIAENPKIWIHAIDMQGTGTQQMVGKNVNLVAGWSEKVLKLIHLKEQGNSSLIKEILKTNV